MMLRSLAPATVFARPSRAVRLVVRAGPGDLEPWQVNKLNQALLAGRRQVKVEKLCKELGLPRGEVLQWLKDAPAPDRTQSSLLEARAAAEEAARERQALLRESRQQQQQQGPAAAGGSRSDSSGGSRSAGGGGRGGSAPAWKSYEKKKGLGKQAEATLEAVFARTQWPSDDAVASLWELHRLPRERVIGWFKQRRQQEERERGGRPSSGGGGGGGGRGGSRGGKGGSGSGGSGKGSIDWDAEWGSF